jgi:hypothetical protein
MQRCTKCGSESDDSANFCKSCGAEMVKKSPATISHHLVTTAFELDGYRIVSAEVLAYGTAVVADKI